MTTPPLRDPDAGPWLGDDQDARKYALHADPLTAQAALTAHLAHDCPNVPNKPPAGHETLTIDRETQVAFIIGRDFHGIIVAHGNRATSLPDGVSPSVLDHLTGPERAVLSARLRAWATILDQEPTQ